MFGVKNLQAKFLLGLAAIVLLLGAFFASGLYFHLNSLLDSQVRDKADLVLAQVNSVQTYVRETLRPKMFKTLSEGEFIIEAMSTSYVSRKIMDRLNSGDMRYHYRRVAENARNPVFEVNADEQELLAFFRKYPEALFWEGYRDIGGTRCFVKARPVVYKQSCLTCHGVPEDAPAVLLERYGAERGFAHEAGSTGGVVVVGIPVEAAVGKIREATAGYAALYGGGMIIFFALIQGFFNRLVVHNLHRLTHKFRSLFHDEPELGDMEKLTQGDEIEEVVQGLEELGDYLHDVNSRLRQHTGNLEQMVRERTSELEAEAGERRADVELFVQLLDGLNKSHSRRDLWLHALPLIVERFHAREASLVCLLASQTFYNWPLGTDDPKLPENWRAIIGECRPEWDEHRAFIPVGASDASTEGILCLTWDEGTRIKEQDKNVLRALGQQLGIAMENLSALHNLLRHKGMLQAIVEGIRDPVLLMDGACRVVLANEAARTLAGSFGGSASELSCSGLFAPGGVLDGCPLERALIRGEPVSREVETGDGRLFVINVFPVAEGTAQEGRGVVYIRDVTQEKRMIESMQQSERLATVGQLAAGLAHEMNNPLGVIKCYAELLKGAEPGQDILPDAEVILKHASQAQNVLQDLLNFARPKQAVQAPLDLRAAVRGAMSVFRFQAEKKGVRVERELPADLPPVMANEQSVEQIMANLLKNALDAVPEQGGRIRVQLRHLEAEEAIEIRVADNGSGVRDEDVKKLFDPFYTTKEVGEGTGLGLAIVYGLVQEMGGTIDIENDGGAVFVVVIPVVNPRFGGQP